MIAQNCYHRYYFYDYSRENYLGVKMLLNLSNVTSYNKMLMYEALSFRALSPFHAELTLNRKVIVERVLGLGRAPPLRVPRPNPSTIFIKYTQNKLN